MPRISILLPAYNEEKHIEQAVNSVLNQTIHDVELIVVDDGSSDNTQSIVLELASRDSRVKAIFPGKVGKNAAYNIAFEASSSDLFVFFAGDDVLPPESIEKRIAPFSNLDPKMVRAVSFGRLRILSEWKRYNNLVLPKSKRKGVRTGGTMAFTRAMAEKMFPLPSSFPNEDTWSMLCIEAFSEIKVEIEDIVLIYRIHEGNSNKRGIPFKIANEEFHKRYLVYDYFLKSRNSQLDKINLINIKKKIELEQYRYHGKLLRILTIRGVSTKQKLRALFHSREFIYNFKIKFERFFYGH